MVEDTEDAQVVDVTLAFKTRLKSSLPSALTKPSLRVPWNCQGQGLGGGGWGKISRASDTHSHPCNHLCLCMCVRETVCVTVGQMPQGGTHACLSSPQWPVLCDCRLMSGWQCIEPVVSPSLRLVPPAAG